MKTKENIYTVAQFAKIYTAKHGGACHRNNIYHLIESNKLPQGASVTYIAGTTFIQTDETFKTKKKKAVKK